MDDFIDPDKRPIPEREADIYLPAEYSTRGVSIWIAERLFSFEETDFCWTNITSSTLDLEKVQDPVLYLKKVSEHDANPIRAKAAQRFLEELDCILLGLY
jgi:hypothetical protein